MLVMPSSAAASFIFLTKASSVVASQRASNRATLLADGSISISSASYWVSCWPSLMATVDWSVSLDSWAAALSTVSTGPVSPFFSGWSRRIR